MKSNKIYKILTTLPLMAILAGCAVESTVSTPESGEIEQISKVAQGQPFTYDDYAAVLSTYVNTEGQVNYQTLKENRQQLDFFNADLASLDRSTYESWTEAEKIAFWVNAYNSLTLQAIIDNYPVESIKDISGVWTRLQFIVMGEPITLNDIEHQILRQEFNEPRIHMALVCASIGCPLLRTEPFLGAKLESQLDEQTAQFLSYSRNLKLDRDANTVSVSSIFKWFGEDWEDKFATEEKFEGFNGDKRAVLNFISQYANEEDKAYLTAGGYRLKYLDYDWGLNQQ